MPKPNAKHLELLKRGVDAWNEWRNESSITPDLSGADLRGADLQNVDFTSANLIKADLREAYLNFAAFTYADLSKADLRKAHVSDGSFGSANLSGADLRGADLSWTNLHRANLRGADLRGANLEEAALVETDLGKAVLTGCRIYGISAWNLRLSKTTRQRDLVITRWDEPEVTADNIEVAQFVYLLLHNEKIRDVIDTVGKKGVLLLGRFTEGRIAVLEQLRQELRKRGYLPIVFNFDKPDTKTFTETLRILAGLSRFVIADVTDPQSVPAELQEVVPAVMVPFVPIVERGKKPFRLLDDLWIKHRDWFFEPIHYSSLDALVKVLDEEIIKPAEARFDQLMIRKAETMKGRHI
jgi:Pentapeptide repeats (8 copies)